MSTQTVYLLWHTHILDDEEDSKLIGVYSSQELAEEKIVEYRSVEGFKNNPDDFEIASYQLDQDFWTEGFVTTT